MSTANIQLPFRNDMLNSEAYILLTHTMESIQDSFTPFNIVHFCAKADYLYTLVTQFSTNEIVYY